MNKKTKKERDDFISDLMDLALRLDRLNMKHWLKPDKAPVIELYFYDISDLMSVEYKVLSSMSAQGYYRGDSQNVTGHSEFSDCREYTIGPMTLRLRCEKVLDVAGGPRFGVRDIAVNYPRS